MPKRFSNARTTRDGARPALEIRRYAPALGAEVRGVDLAHGLDPATYEQVRAALLAHQVLFFKDQTEISPRTQIGIGRMFGELHMHPAAPQMAGYPEIFEIYVSRNSKIANGEFWHSDVSCDEVPPLGTILQLHILPPVGATRSSPTCTRPMTLYRSR